MASAVALARRSGARLTFAHALEGGNRIDEPSRRELVRELGQLLAPHLAGFEAEYRLMNGGLAAAALQAEAEFDLVLPADGEPGSEAAARELNGLLRRSPLPVWIDRGTGEPPRGILAALDLQTRNPLKQALNLTILERALLLAAAFGARLDLLSVWTPPVASERLVRRLAGETEPARPSRKELQARLEELLADAMTGSPAIARQPRLLTAQGDPDELIVRAAESTSVDLLVAGCLGRSGLAAWLVGDTAERLARRLDCSILAIKPSRRLLDEVEAGQRSRAA